MSNKGWSKYGGGMGGNEAIYKQSDWYCQSCQSFQYKETIVFTHYHNGEWLRVCEGCANDDCEEITKRVANS